jgi:hypothetical protein
MDISSISCLSPKEAEIQALFRAQAALNALVLSPHSHEQRVEEPAVLLGAPWLPGLGHGVGLPRLLPRRLVAPLHLPSRRTGRNGIPQNPGR